MEPWDGILDATNESTKNTNGLEDRLYLNVYSPKVDKKSLPVMFWIRGGRFSSGHNGPDLSGPEYFMDKDVILVSINYRLGVLGTLKIIVLSQKMINQLCYYEYIIICVCIAFLSTEDDVMPDNNGMKDQVMARRWIHTNFNGDFSQVTIFRWSLHRISYVVANE